MNSETTQTSTKEISLTPEAAKEINRIRMENKIPDSHALRICVQSGGCCGPSYSLAFDDKSDATDAVFQTEGIKLLVDAQSAERLWGATLEYVTDQHGSGFKFNNPNAEESCGCGESGCGDGSCGGH